MQGGPPPPPYTTSQQQQGPLSRSLPNARRGLSSQMEQEGALWQLQAQPQQQQQAQLLQSMPPPQQQQYTQQQPQQQYMQQPPPPQQQQPPQQAWGAAEPDYGLVAELKSGADLAPRTWSPRSRPTHQPAFSAAQPQSPAPHRWALWCRVQGVVPSAVGGKFTTGARGCRWG